MKTKTKQSFAWQQKQRGIYWKVSIDVVPRCVCKYFAASAATWQHQRPLWRRPAPPLLVVVSTSTSSSIVAVAVEARANVRANANGDRKLFKLSKH